MVPVIMRDFVVLHYLLPIFKENFAFGRMLSKYTMNSLLDVSYHISNYDDALIIISSS